MSIDAGSKKYNGHPSDTDDAHRTSSLPSSVWRVVPVSLPTAKNNELKPGLLPIISSRSLIGVVTVYTDEGISALN
ncbi:MAG: hypothetical protein ACLTXL_14315 [Clostridia bacterium]